MSGVSDRWAERIAQRYGRKQGLYRHYKFLILYRLGRFQRFQETDWNRVRRLVFVCRGNICRSPYAERRARVLGIPAASFGLEADGCSPPDRTAVRISRQRGLELNGHHARPTSEFSPGPEDLLVGMEPWHGQRLLHLSIGSGAQVTLLGLWCRPPRPHIEDPYSLGERYYQTCFASMDDAIERIARRIRPSEQRPRQE